jgi:rhodanese-related sulfurtransferase
MEQFIEFVGNHPYLFTALFIVIALLIGSIVGELLWGAQAVLPQEATLLINREDALILDVREENEYKQGHILNAMHIPLGALSSKIGRLEKFRNRPIVANCLNGHRSARACSLLKKQGFEKVYNLKGGINAWQEASLPITRGKS